MELVVAKAIAATQSSEVAYCKFITANDTGDTGGHQSGYHIHKNAWALAFDQPGEKGSNKDHLVKIRWQDDFETDSRFIYYGVGTRNEYRLTRFGKGFPFLGEDNVGDLLILLKASASIYQGFVLHSDEDIEEFLNAFGISASETNRLIERQVKPSDEERLIKCFRQFINTLTVDFPSTDALAMQARNCYMTSYSVTEKDVLSDPDGQLLKWIDAEYELFKTIESNRYEERIKTLFKNVEELVDFANTILNRRKSRAGRSLEHHLKGVFDIFKVAYTSQGITEDNKKPDFIFPDIDAYHDNNFDSSRLFFLASKTTCKDRWRQVLNEADRIKEKHLFTLQQGISKNQLAEMSKYGVTLVVPRQYVSSYPQEYRHKLMTLESFIQLVNSRP